MTVTARPAQQPPSGPAVPPNAMTRGIAVVVGAVVLGIIIFRATAPDSGDASSSVSTDTAAVTDSSTPATDSTDATPTTHPLSEVRVLAANGSGVKGAAGRTAEVLQTLGYGAMTPTDATAEAESSAVYYVAGFDLDAQGVAASLGLTIEQVLPMPTPPPVATADLADATVVVVVGPDLVAKLP